MQAAADDLRVFVEVLQSFCDDPRDLAEVRASEASLKNQLAAAQKQLKGHELQVLCPPRQRPEGDSLNFCIILLLQITVVLGRPWM